MKISNEISVPVGNVYFMFLNFVHKNVIMFSLLFAPRISDTPNFLTTATFEVFDALLVCHTMPYKDQYLMVNVSSNASFNSK